MSFWQHLQLLCLLMLRSQTIQQKEIKLLKEAVCMFTGTLRTQKDDPAFIIYLSCKSALNFRLLECFKFLGSCLRVFSTCRGFLSSQICSLQSKNISNLLARHSQGKKEKLLLFNFTNKSYSAQ